MAQAVLARQSRGCEVGVLPQEGGTGAQSLFQGSFCHLQTVLGPCHQPLRLEVCIWISQELCLQLQSLPLCAQCFIKAKEP